MKNHYADVCGMGRKESLSRIGGHHQGSLDEEAQTHSSIMYTSTLTKPLPSNAPSVATTKVMEFAVDSVSGQGMVKLSLEHCFR